MLMLEKSKVCRCKCYVPAPETTSVFICPKISPSANEFALAVPDVNSVNGTVFDIAPAVLLVS